MELELLQWNDQRTPCASMPNSKRRWRAILTSSEIVSSHITPRDCPEAFTGVYVHPRGYGAVNPPGRTPTFWQIWDLDLWILNSNKMSGTLPGVFTAPHPRWWTYTPVNASGQSLGPVGVMWELCRPNESAEKAHRRCRAKRRILRFVFGKKHALFGHSKNLISRFEGVRLTGKIFNLNFRVLWPSNSLEMNL